MFALLHVRAFAGKYLDPEHFRLFARALRRVQLVNPELTWMLVRSNFLTILEFSKGDLEDMVSDT